MGAERKLFKFQMFLDLMDGLTAPYPIICGHNTMDIHGLKFLVSSSQL